MDSGGAGDGETCSCGVGGGGVSCVRLSSRGCREGVGSHGLRTSSGIGCFYRPSEASLCVTMMSPSGAGFRGGGCPTVIVYLNNPGVGVPSFRCTSSVCEEFDGSSFCIVVPLEQKIVNVAEQ